MSPRRQLGLVVLSAVVLAGILAVLSEPLFARRLTFFLLLTTLVPAGAIAYLVYRAHPAWTISIAVALSVFSGNWDEVGIPGYLAPDRLLLLGGIGAVLIRAPMIRDRPPLRIEPVHWLLAVTAAYAAFSALAAGTLGHRDSIFGLLEHLGILPFALFLVAPIVYRTEWARRILLGALVALGAYLGMTALFETIGARELLFPSYIADPNVGIHVGRARGPFVEAVSNGVGLFVGALAAGVAVVVWRDPAWRRVAAVVLLLCTAGGLFTLQRSVWLGFVVSAAVIFLSKAELRRVAVPVLGAGLALVLTALAAVPGLADNVGERNAQQETVWDRQNQTRAALNMVAERPLIGFGWDQFPEQSIEYYEQSDSYPLSAAGLGVHSVYLRYATELGLIGMVLWIFALLVAVGGAIARRAPPDLEPWRIALLGYTVFFLTISSFVPAQIFPSLIVWLLAGVVTAGRPREEDRWPQGHVPQPGTLPAASA